MPENSKIFKEDATKRLIDLLRESDDADEKSTLPTSGPSEQLTKGRKSPGTPKIKAKPAPAAAEDDSTKVLRPDETAEREGEGSELLQFLSENAQKEDSTETSPVAPPKPPAVQPVDLPEPEASGVEDEDEDDLIIPANSDPDDDVDLDTLLADDPGGLSAVESESSLPLSSGSRSLQDLLANLDSSLNSDDELLGGGASDDENGNPFTGLHPEKNEKNRPAVIDADMVNAKSAEQPPSRQKNIPRPSTKYLKKFQYETLYDSEKTADDEYMQNWNAGSFFRSVLYLKDTAVGLDFGDEFIRFIEVKKRQDKIEISNWGYTRMIREKNAPNAGFARKKNEDNFSVVFNAYAQQNRLKSKYVAHAIQNKNIVSRVMGFPKLSHKEVGDAIELNARKNLPFPDKFAQIDFAEIGSSGEAQKKYNYLVGIAHERTVNSITARFKEAHILPRKLFSASFATWSLFKNNYPDMEDQTVILLHIGPDTSSIIFINEGILQFDREIPVGHRDFREALTQKVRTLNGEHIISEREAEVLLHNYGFPLEQEGVTELLQIEAYRLLILLRSEGERLISEINRSIDFYRKVFSLPPLEADIYLSGPGGSIPGLNLYINKQLNRNVRRMYPLRSGTIRYAEGVEPIPPEFLSQFDLALASATEIDNHTNLIPKNLKFEEKFIPAYMASVILLLLTLLAITVSSFAVSSQLNAAKKEVARLDEEIETIAPMGRKYSDMINYHNAAYTIKNELNRDIYVSKMTTDIMRFVSQNTQNEVKLHQMRFNAVRMEKSGNSQVKAAEQQDPTSLFMQLEGFVTTSNAVADLQLTNYVIKLQNSGLFSEVEILYKEREVNKDAVRLNFYIQAEVVN